MTHCVLVPAREVYRDGAADGLAVQNLLVMSVSARGLHCTWLDCRETRQTHDRCLGQEGIRQDMIKGTLSVYADAYATFSECLHDDEAVLETDLFRKGCPLIGRTFYMGATFRHSERLKLGRPFTYPRYESISTLQRIRT